LPDSEVRKIKACYYNQAERQKKNPSGPTGLGRMTNFPDNGKTGNEDQTDDEQVYYRY
jgi:hypothetical protein